MQYKHNLYKCSTIWFCEKKIYTLCITVNLTNIQYSLNSKFKTTGLFEENVTPFISKDNISYILPIIFTI